MQSSRSQQEAVERDSVRQEGGQCQIQSVPHKHTSNHSPGSFGNLRDTKPIPQPPKFKCWKQTSKDTDSRKCATKHEINACPEWLMKCNNCKKSRTTLRGYVLI